MEASDPRCSHLVVEDSVKELPSGLLEQSHCQAVKQEVSFNNMLQLNLFNWPPSIKQSVIKVLIQK